MLIEPKAVALINATKKMLCTALVLGIPFTAACSSGFITSSNGQGGTQANEKRPPRVETTGSLISRPAVGYVDDGNSDTAPNSVTQTGAKSVSELLNGNTAMQGTNMRALK